jgi:probable rRNA maturation factor
LALSVCRKSNYVSGKLLREISEEVFSYIGKSPEIGLDFVSSKRSKELNKRYRGKDSPTNVLSFSVDEMQNIGEILICEEVVKKEAKESGYAVKDMILLYLVHGILHLAGYDHQSIKERDKMEQVETEILGRKGIIIERD